MTTIYAATTNAGKLREFTECARREESNSFGNVEVLPLPGIELLPVPVEDAANFMGNAELKAKAYSRQKPGLLVIADDSGLAVQALEGRPGVHSARFAEEMGFGPDTDPSLAGAWTGMSKDERNNLCLLWHLKHVPSVQEGHSLRYARFVCALVLARNGEVVLRAEGDVSGQVLLEPRGTNGFGYDPLFLVAEAGLTMAELPVEEKWRVSHRGRAFRELAGKLDGHPVLEPSQRNTIG